MAALAAPNLEVGERVLTKLAAVTLASSYEEDEDKLRNRGEGTLFITSLRVVWLPTSSETEPFECEATSLNMHAVSREGVESFARPCIYCQLDQTKGLPEEVYFAPADQTSLEECFRSFSQTALMNPPPNDDEEGGGVFGVEGEGFYGEVGDEFVASEEGASAPSPEPSEEQRAAMLAHLDSILQVPPHLEVHAGQFDHAVAPNADGP
jgi:hypothetical protein